MEDDSLSKKKRQLKGLFKNLSEEELTRKALESLEKKSKTEEIDLDDIFVNPSEKKYANEILAKYLNEFTIESISDKNTLKQLIFLEIINYRLQSTLNTLYNASSSLDKDTLEMIHKNQDKILALKTSLGLIKDKKNEVKDGYGYWQTIKKKYKIWLQENQASRTICCPYCAKLVYLKIKTDAWEAQRHPWFKDRVLGNVHLMKLFVQGKLSPKDLALVFETSEDYVFWLLEKWKSNPEYKDIVSNKDKTTEEVNEEVN